MRIAVDLAPVQHGGQRNRVRGICPYGKPCAPRLIPRSIAEACYREWYAVEFPSSAAHQSLDQLLRRGGFGCGELDMWNPEWRSLL